MSSSSASPLFKRLLGEDFDTLPESVRRLHLRQGVHLYRGEVQVDRGEGLLSRLCGWVTHLPPAGCCPITVEIDASTSRELWTRRVRGRDMSSRLWASGDLLCERLGLVTFGFRIRSYNGQLQWSVVRVSALGIPLPTLLFSSVSALEAEAGELYTFDVTATLPFVGLLVHYRGWLQVT